MSGKIDIDVRAGEPVDLSGSGLQEFCVSSVATGSSKPSRVGLLAHCGTGNLGDEASITAVLDNITLRSPGVSVVGLSMDPEDTTRRLGIPCYAMRQRVFPFQREWSSASHPAGPGGFAWRLKATVKKTGPLFHIANALRHALVVWPSQFFREIMFLLRSLLLVWELDMLIIAGGGQLLDWGGPWAFPYTLFKWVLLAKCANVKCIFVNNGAGPLDSSLSRWFIRRTLAMADYVSLRDGASGDLLRKIGFRGKMKVVADAVWGLRLPERPAKEPVMPSTQLVIGVGPMAYGDSKRHWVNDDQGYRRLIDNLAAFCGQMLARGHRIRLFSSDIWFDSQAIADLDAAIRQSFPALAPDRVTRETVESIADMLAALSHVDFYVTCRFHGVVFASLQTVPTIALAPHPKVTTLMESLGLSDYCVDIARCDAADLVARADRLIADRDGIKARIGVRAAQFKSQLNLQFNALFLANEKTCAEGTRYSQEGALR
ncbi:polysaccharide pyruvyl transferase family protein [Bosea sp. SSUT16]|jgi:polysaccharide pyruvyl transferase WcaK-like protein|uniref:Polysaccharide pyruvyl transferase family protein n=1 Tax=Bosea spartocytisi TaxID=2773451 RepID=A0A927I1H6_9HYPH|nr:polysaccharide pyruvyl transferase family protein [Bosea spartocytisi]MBD3848399.1 polysaccharide pyruvyl transferase family protein [Bosea spartocytisi]MCT4472748.1 polysaccharide pyruvyl transferase family protein [Bosea spartocytisi]